MIAMPTDLSLRLLRCTALLLLMPLVNALPGQASAEANGESCALVDIHQIGSQRLEELKALAEGAAWWIELDRVLLMCGSDILVAKAAGSSQLERQLEGLAFEQLWVARGAHQSDLAGGNIDVLAESGGVVLLRAPRPDVDALVERLSRVAYGRARIEPAVRNTVLVRQAANKPPRARVLFAPEVQGLVDLIDADRWFADIETLATFNRYTHNSGIVDARDWLVAEFGTMPGLSITTPSFNVNGTTAYNVIATLPGPTRPDEWYIIGAHYDAISETPQVAAPGAEDNASGCAGVLEMARIFTAHRPEATLMFICYSGEELGLLGSKDHVNDLLAAEDLDKVQTMLNLDMIGYTSDGDLDCRLETEPFAATLFDVFEDAALQFTTLRIVTDTNACCSDHKPYLNRFVPALLTIENDYFQYPFYHTTNDLPEHLTLAMGHEILKMNVAAMAQILDVPEPAFFTDGFESGDTSLWTLTLP